MNESDKPTNNRYVFTGRVHPERATLVVPRLGRAWQTPSGEERVWFKIDWNQVTVVIESPKGPDELHTLRNIAKSEVEVATSVIGYLHGSAYDVEISQFISEELDSSHVFNIGIPALEGRYVSEELGTYVKALLNLCCGPYGVFLQRALGDLGMAVRHASDTPFYCYRALESIKQHFATVHKIDEKDDKAQWKAAGKALSAGLNDVESIRRLAFPARHGVPKPISDAQRKDIFLVTWDIVEKFTDYRLAEEEAGLRLSSIRVADKPPISDGQS